MRARRAIACALGAAAAIAACKPSLDDRVSIVTARRVLAVRADPAEAPPKGAVALSALVVDPGGTLSDAPLDWAYCDLRKPLAELGPVSPDCMAQSGDFLTELGVGLRVAATVPETACRQFGPEVPQAQKDQPAGRPVDADLTGGYYEPLRLALGDGLTLERARITCGLAGATAEQLADYGKRYRANTNPEVDALGADGAAVAADGAGAPATLAPGAHVTLRASWAACDPTKSCTGAETYPVFDLASRALVDRREAIRVSWFATGGAFDVDHTGRDGDDPSTFSEDGFTAPASAGTVHVWIVVRDERGGAGWRAYTIDVR